MRHCTDAELMAILDGEGERAHFDGCAQCRTRGAELAGALREFTALHRGGWGAGWGRYAAAAALVVVGGMGLWLLRGRTDLPDAALTPGATRPMTQAEVCVAAAQDDEQRAPREMAAEVFARYGIRNPAPRAYEVDYLISPALGGAEEIRNLWPQPYGGSVWTARVKDALEDYLRKRVCNGRLELATAQEEIATDWIGAYRKYFQTDRPLREHAGFVKDRPWE